MIMSKLDLENIQIAKLLNLYKDYARDFSPWLTENGEHLRDNTIFPNELCITEKEAWNLTLKRNK